MTTATLGTTVAQPGLDTRFHELLGRYQAPVTRLASAYEPNRADREDLVQDIWLGIWRALPGFRAECSERTFVYRVAHNRAITHVSRRRPVTTDLEDALDVPHPAPAADQEMTAAQERDRLLAAVQRLPLVQREVVTLSLEGLPHREIAQVLGITENNVAVRLNRARAQLACELGDRT
jgi:RNA polymerase sigma-70 factor (ECF subfamily)